QAADIERMSRVKAIAARHDEQSVINAAIEAKEREMRALGDLSKEKEKESNGWDREVANIRRRISTMEAEVESIGQAAGALEGLRVKHQMTEFAASHHLKMTEAMTKTMEELQKRAEAAKNTVEKLRVA